MVYEISEPTYLTLREDRPYTFSDIFKLQAATDEIVAAYGYTLVVEELTLPKAELPSDEFEQMEQEFKRKLDRYVLMSETARREFYIAPILWRLQDHTKFRVFYEYAVDIRPNLRGVIDYILRSQNQTQIVVLEAKKADMEGGFNQLAVEMIAMDELESPSDTSIYGIVSIGELWRFGRLDRTTKQIYKDVNAFHIPNDLHGLFSVLLGILQEK